MGGAGWVYWGFENNPQKQKQPFKHTYSNLIFHQNANKAQLLREQI